MPKQPVAVVVPMYKNQLTPNELTAWHQCQQVLCQHPLVIVKPRSLNLDQLLTQSSQIQLMSFDDAYFESVSSYNRLMMSALFYKSFLDFEHILIHQLDAYVFRDELLFWCHQPYDYIGAPWLSEQAPNALKKNIARWLKLKHPSSGAYRDIIRFNSVGNGGFSLRRVQPLLSLIPKFQSTIDFYLAQDNYRYNEDVFWGIEVNRYRQQLRTPPYQTALRFAVETYPSVAHQLNQHQLPFGCHAFEVYEPDFWKNFINFE